MLPLPGPAREVAKPHLERIDRRDHAEGVKFPSDPPRKFEELQVDRINRIRGIHLTGPALIGAAPRAIRGGPLKAWRVSAGS
jgi:hypothetical protein